MIKGLYKSKFRGIHAAMKTRCYNSKSKDYKHYGGRGIRVCEKWQSAQGFAEDMYETYIVGLSIERIDVNDDYCPQNCIWIPKSEQWKNKRDSFITYDGVALRKRQWIQELGITPKMFFRIRNKLNLSFEEAIHLFKNPNEIPLNLVNLENKRVFDINPNHKKTKTYVEPVIIDGKKRFYIRDVVTNEIRNII